MDVNKISILKTGFQDKQINIPVQLTWDYLGLDMAIDEYEGEVVTQVIGVGRDFEVTRFDHAPQTGSTDNTEVKYEFNFYSGGTLNNIANWKPDYRMEGFTSQEIFYYTNNFTNSFFKLDLYDTVDEKKQKNYVTLIIPTQQGLKTDAIMNRTPVSIKTPRFVLDYVGDKEGFFIYWLKKRNFIDISTFYMSAKFFDAKIGSFVSMVNRCQSEVSGDKYAIDSLTYYYYRVNMDYNSHTYQIFDINPDNPTYNLRVGTTIPIKWFEYVNPK